MGSPSSLDLPYDSSFEDETREEQSLGNLVRSTRINAPVELIVYLQARGIKASTRLLRPRFSWHPAFSSLLPQKVNVLMGIALGPHWIEIYHFETHSHLRPYEEWWVESCTQACVRVFGAFYD